MAEFRGEAVWDAEAEVWVRLSVKAVRFLIPSEIRVFPTVQAEEGRAWITARPGLRADAEFYAPVPPLYGDRDVCRRRWRAGVRGARLRGATQPHRTRPRRRWCFRSK